MFRALRIFEEEPKKFTLKLVERSIDELPEGEVLVRVKYSSLNYKDALSSIGNRGVTRNFPHTPGIDAAGVVEDSSVNDFAKGDEVILTGYDLGMNTDGGFGEYIRVPASWVVKKPEGITLKEAMIYGTAGFTAALSVFELVKDVKKEDGDILITGASGGVGSHALKILVKLGYSVIGVVNTKEEEEFIKKLGAIGAISREDSSDESGKAMLKQQWAGVIDTVGGNPLSTAIRSVKYGGTVTTCGNVAGGDIPVMNVYPFILRGVKLVGIDSVNCQMEKRLDVWKKLSSPWKGEKLDNGIQEVSLDEISLKIKEMLSGSLVGRVVLKHK